MMPEDDTRWSWRWKCPTPDCGFLVQGQGDRHAKEAAEDVIRDHRAVDGILARRAS